MDYGDNIKAARKAAGMTQAQLAEKCNVATITIQQYERGKREPRIEQLKKIAKALGVSELYLLGHASQDNSDDIDLGLVAINYEKLTGVDRNTVMNIIDAMPETLDFRQIQKNIQTQLGATLFSYFERLNTEGQQKAVSYVEDLAGNEKYQRQLQPADGSAEPPEDEE